MFQLTGGFVYLMLMLIIVSSVAVAKTDPQVTDSVCALIVNSSRSCLKCLVHLLLFN